MIMKDVMVRLNDDYEVLFNNRKKSLEVNGVKISDAEVFRSLLCKDAKTAKSIELTEKTEVPA